ncbi:cellulase family glycosylhydrolase [Flammeovirga agarivorans]|uniref:Cellulase family glycosylhydrolase n=1 Tax=Flammeovirga agarivorans TaxID=2726742 RepID=A0A7X8XV17_9BACT|nr:cellulase family glycosylhydrolase [Flammeovirga agarivorans]NLR90799.1 cellulase family glycosylhydrolase [Flammeovirga agarivorans]
MKIKLLLTFLLCTFSSYAQLSPHDAVTMMGRGINLGNTLDAPYEGEWALKAEEYYFDDYKSAGFQSVRIPVTWHNHVSESTPYTVDKEFMDRVEQVVDWALSRGFMVILNCHHEDWLKEDYSSANIARYEKIWEQIVQRFKDKSEKLVFEPFNEPRTLEKSLTISQAADANKRALHIIRKENPTRNVVISGTGWSAIKDLLEANFPNDEYIIGYYHTYDPWPFSSAQENIKWGSEEDREYIAQEFQKVKNWSTQKGIPVIMSEFGSVHQTDYNSRMIHYATYVEEALTRGISFMAWDDGGMFEIYKRKDRAWHDTKDILIHYSEKCIDQLKLSTSSDSIINFTWESRIALSTRIQIKSGNQFIDIDTLDSELESYAYSGITPGKSYTFRLMQLDESDTLYSYPQKISILPSERTPYKKVINLPGSIEAEDYDIGGQGFTYFEKDEINQGGAYRDEGVDIEENAEGFHVGYAEDGEWLEYSVDVQESGIYKLTAHLASAEGGGKLSIYSKNDKTNKLEFNASNTGGWNVFEEVEGFLSLSEGAQVIRLLIESTPAYNIDKVDFELTDREILSTHQLENEISIYPNPAFDQVSLKLPMATRAIDIQVLDAIGNTMIIHQISQDKLDIKSLPRGLYFIRVKVGEDLIYKRLIKQ